MHNPFRRRVPAPAREDSFGTRVWKGIELTVTAIVQDIFLFIVLIAGLVVAYLCLEILKLLGYNRERIDTLESLHYWAYVSTLGVFLLDLLWTIVLHTSRKR